jgi:CDGSH-type Zn-finger protein
VLRFRAVATGRGSGMPRREPTSVDAGALGPLDERTCEIRVYPDGPYLVRGAFELVDADGTRTGIRRRTIALCRCGRSRTAPFCDGTHQAVGFTSREPVCRTAAAAAAAGSPPA